jgi:effector-binding domain-containing protein
MISEPKIETRDIQSYVAIRVVVPREEIGRLAPPLVPQVFGWLDAQGVAPAGAPFFRYHGIDADGKMDISVSVPVATPVAGNGHVVSSEFPAGRYAVTIYTGPYEQLIDAHMALMAWGEKHKIAWEQSADGMQWSGRTEFYITDPSEESDPTKLRTEVAFLLAKA